MLSSELTGLAGTLASSVYERIREDILIGRLQPGEKLRIDTLRQRYTVGGSPIREALNRLSSEGLVLQHDQRGFGVLPASIEDLVDSLPDQRDHAAGIPVTWRQQMGRECGARPPSAIADRALPQRVTGNAEP